MNVYHFTIAWRNLVQGAARSIARDRIGCCRWITDSLAFLVQWNSSEPYSCRNNHCLRTRECGWFLQDQPQCDYAPVVNNRDEIKAVIKDASPHIVSIIDRHRGWAKMVTEEDLFGQVSMASTSTMKRVYWSK